MLTLNYKPQNSYS